VIGRAPYPGRPVSGRPVFGSPHRGTKPVTHQEQPTAARAGQQADRTAERQRQPGRRGLSRPPWSSGGIARATRRRRPGAKEGGPGTRTPVRANTLPTSPGQLARGVFQRIDRIGCSGSPCDDGLAEDRSAVRHAVLVSTTPGRHGGWLRSEMAEAQPRWGTEAVRMRAAQRGLDGIRRHAIWTSQDGQSGRGRNPRHHRAGTGTRSTWAPNRRTVT